MKKKELRLMGMVGARMAAIILEHTDMFLVHNSAIFIPKSTVLGSMVGWFSIIIFPLPFVFPGDGSVVH